MGGPGSQIPNSKYQIPSSKGQGQITNHKTQIPNTKIHGFKNSKIANPTSNSLNYTRQPLGIWDLGFGAWDFLLHLVVLKSQIQHPNSLNYTRQPLGIWFFEFGIWIFSKHLVVLKITNPTSQFPKLRSSTP